MALAERRPDDLKAAMEKLGQEAPSGRQLFMLRMMGLLIPPASAGIVARIRGILLLIALVIVLLAVGFGLVELIALPFGGVGTGPAIFFGFLLVVIVIGVLVMLRQTPPGPSARRASGALDDSRGLAPPDPAKIGLPLSSRRRKAGGGTRAPAGRRRRAR